MESAPQKKQTRQIQELPSEIWSQILLCLPAITVIQLKIVCKSWLELINSNHFRISHVDHWRIRDNPLPPQFMSVLLTDLVGDDKVLLRVGRPLRFDRLCFRRSQRRRRLPSSPMETAVLDCCDGLFLVRILDRYLFLCNPLTDSYIRLPFPKRKDLITNNNWTVVYDPSTRGYVIFCAENTYPAGIEVVSSLRVDLNGRKSANNWRQVWSSSQNLTPTIFFRFIASISNNGKAHWLFSFHDIYEYVKKIGILTINAATEESTVTMCSCALPWVDFFTGGYFLASNRKFYYLKESSLSREALELWAIEDVDNPTWLKHHVIIKMDILQKMDLYNFSVNLKEGNRLIIRTRNSRDMFIYDISRKKWQTIDIVDSENLCRGHELKFMSMSISYSLLSW